MICKGSPRRLFRVNGSAKNDELGVRGTQYLMSHIASPAVRRSLGHNHPARTTSRNDSWYAGHGLLLNLEPMAR